MVIHVNGTRGKSTVTRMIHAMLCKQGMAAFGKTTGSAARLLLPCGGEKPVRRLGSANVREQRNMMILCAFLLRGYAGKKAALVFECNAVKKELQYISSRWLSPDITVVTNARSDHTQELGSAKEAAAVFAQAVPQNSSLITQDSNFMDTWEAAAKQKNLKLFFVDRDSCKTANQRLAPVLQEARSSSIRNAMSEFPENEACVLGVADCLGIDRFQALAAANEHRPDAGVFKIYSWKDTDINGEGRSFFFADARAANDIESTERLLFMFFDGLKPDANSQRIFLLSSREDRPERSWDFLQYIKALSLNATPKGVFDSYLFLGHTPLAFKRAVRRFGINCSFLRQTDDLEAALKKVPVKTVYIFGAGNFAGKSAPLSLWLKAKEKTGQ